jgi:hypothetical protein
MPDSSPKSKKARLQQSRRYAQPRTASRDYDIGKTTLFTWMQEGWIRSVVVRRPGSRKALRLIDVSSLEDFLAKNVIEPKTKFEIAKLPVRERAPGVKPLGRVQIDRAGKEDKTDNQ